MTRLCFGSVLLAVSIPFGAINAAEVIVNGEKVQSRIYVNEFVCDGYSILIKEDRFPYEVEDDIEKNSVPVLPGFFGNGVTVGAAAFVKKNGIEHPIPDVSKEYQKSGKLLNDGRVYLPGLGYCLDKSTFLLSVWSGGNCKQCEVLIKYQLDSAGRVVRVGSPSREEWQKIMSAPIPQPIKH